MTSTEKDYQGTIRILQKQREHINERIHGFRFRGWILITFMTVGGAIGYSYDEVLGHNYYVSHIIFGSLFTGFIYFYTTMLLRVSSQNKIRHIDYELAKLGGEELQKNIEENFFTKLVKINFKYLDQYYLQTQEQADKSFMLAAAASVVGLLIICSGILMMFMDKTNPAYLTTASGVISEIIAALFFYLYNKTVLKMSQYHQKLVITQNISLALRITEDMHEENKQRVQEKIVDSLTIDINKYLTLEKSG